MFFISYNNIRAITAVFVIGFLVIGGGIATLDLVASYLSFCFSYYA